MTATPNSQRATPQVNDTQAGQELQLLGAQPGDNPTMTTIHDVYPPIDLPEPPPYLLYSGIGLIALVIGLLLLFFLKKRKKEAAVVIPMGVRARNDLMQAREMLSQETGLQYMAKVSEILRHYIEARFDLSPTKQTTDEFFRSLSADRGIERRLASFRDELRECLNYCDLAKFARRNADVESMEKMEKVILHFINRTEPTYEEGT